MKLSEFVERFVGHNSTVLLYEERYFIDDDELRTREDKLLWRGMDWQISFNKDDEEYFVNHPEEYKEKRAKKDAQLDYEEGKVNPNVNPYYKPTSFNLKQKEDLPLQKPMEFSKDENGQIRIQGIK